MTPTEIAQSLLDEGGACALAPNDATHLAAVFLDLVAAARRVRQRTDIGGNDIVAMCAVLDRVERQQR